MLSPVFLVNLYKQGTGSCLLNNGEYSFPTTEGSTQIHIINYFWFESEANDKRHSSLSHKSHIPVTPRSSVCVWGGVSGSQNLKVLLGQQRHLNKILKHFRVCQRSRNLSRMPACLMRESSSEPRGAGGVLGAWTWFCTKARSPGSRTLALLAAQWYPRVSVNKTGNEATEGTVALNC